MRRRRRGRLSTYTIPYTQRPLQLVASRDGHMRHIERGSGARYSQPASSRSSRATTNPSRALLSIQEQRSGVEGVHQNSPLREHLRTRAHAPRMRLRPRPLMLSVPPRALALAALIELLRGPLTQPARRRRHRHHRRRVRSVHPRALRRGRPPVPHIHRQVRVRVHLYAAPIKHHERRTLARGHAAKDHLIL